ncbi:MAG TPA: GTPase Era [Roseiflexaceae bacterium]|nr:GTPase Era [Roseiflexaceae bacterium]
MITVSFDPDAGTLYWYFTDIEAGSTDSDGECNGALLLDSAGQVIGVELELDESITLGDLALALQHPQARYDRETMTLTVAIADEEPAEVQPLHESLILDFDSEGRLQGCDLLAAPEFGLAKRLERLEPFQVALDDDTDALPPLLTELDDELDAGTHEQAPAEDAADADEHVTIGVDEEVRPDQAEGETIPSPRRPVAPPPSHAVANFRSGFVALVGKPNAGKSTLLNALLGQKVAIVSPKPQTTRVSQRGILNRQDAQVIFVDTPGIHDPRTKLGSFMVEQARRSIPDADVVCFVVDISAPPNRIEQRIADLARRSRAPRILVLNKLDLRPRGGTNYLEAYRELGPWDMEVAVSALHRKGLETLLDEIVRRLPAGAPLYPDDQLTDQSEREHAAELVREQVLRHIEQEVPHGVAVEVEEWEEKGQAVYIRMTIYVEKESQKGILIGAGGAMLKRIGSGARRGIEEALSRQVYLELWVKVRPNWRDDASSLHWLGYRGGR